MTTEGPVTTAPSREGSGRITTQWLALGAVIGPVPFTLAWAILGALRAGYSSVSEPISFLGVGPHGLIMDGAFVASGALILVGLIGVFLSIREMGVVSRSLSILLLGLSPIGLAICGLFTVDAPSRHYLGVMLATVTPIASFALVGFLLRRVSGWRQFGTWLILGSPLTLALTSIVTVNLTAMIAGHGIGGFAQRVLAVEIFAWFIALGWLAFRAPSNGASATAANP